MSLLSINIAKDKVLKLNKDGKVVVFTNGCFDIIHKGHTTLLNKARKLGDFLIVGLNSNESVSNLKGKDRPINSEEKRSENLLKLDCEGSEYEIINSLPDSYFSMIDKMIIEYHFAKKYPKLLTELTKKLELMSFSVNVKKLGDDMGLIFAVKNQ